MNKCLFLVLVSSLMVVSLSRAWAAEVVFTGGTSGTGTDLAVAANWDGGVLPGTSDTGVVDYSTFAGGANLTVGSNLTLAGLKIKSATAALTLSGSGTLSLGATGLGVDNATALTLRAPIAVTAASVWKFNTGAIDLYSTISGTAALEFSEAGAVSVYNPIGYDGTLLINSSGLRFYAMGKMAKTLKSTGGTDSANCYVSPNAGGTIRWSEVFTGGQFEYTAWRRLYLAVPNGATEAAHIIMDDPHDDFYQNGPYRSGIASGVLEQRDGYLHTSGYGISVGSKEVGTGAAVNSGRFPVEYWLSGGSNDVGYVFIGENAKYFANNPVVKQSGGRSLVHKGVYIGAATDSSEIGFGEYQLSGGLLYARDGTVASDRGSDHQTRGLVLCHPFNGVGSCPGVFTQTGGTNTTLTVKFGPDTKEWGSTPPQSINAGFGLFDFRGGELNFTTATSPFTFGAGWNTSATNSAYRINVSGGTINFKDGHKINAQIELPPSETDATWNVPSGTVTVDAPVSGLGTLKKTGEGQVVFNNLNRFNGTLKVAEGTAKVIGTLEEDASLDAESDNCWIWTADSFNATHTNNQDVASWADDRHGVTAVDWTAADTTFYKEWVKSPTFTQNGKTGLVKGYPKHLPVLVKNDYFNGHSSVRFDQTLLQVPAAENPLAGSTNLTIALVYRENADGSNDRWYGRPIFGGTDYWYGGMDTPILTHDGANRACFNFVYQKNGTTRTIETAASRAGKTLKSTACVAVLTLNGNDYSLNLNGYQTNAVLSSSVVRPMFKYANSNLPLNFGGHFPDSANFSSGSSYIAEVRVYRDQSLTTAQQAMLVRQLMKKYIGDAGEAEFAGELNTGVASSMTGESVPSSPKTTEFEWTADAANAQADGSEVTTLASAAGGRNATTETADSMKGPTLVKNAYNGHSALRFSSAEKTALGINSADLATKGADYAFAVVFCTKTDAPESHQASFNKNSGIGIAVQDLSVGGTHLGFTWHHEGTILAGYGSSWFVNRRPFRLNDGLPHVAVFSRDASGNYIWMVDGRATTGTTTDKQSNTGAGAMLLGKLAKGQETGFFDGDVLAVRMYGSSLTVDEAKALSEHYAYTYGFRLLNYVATKENVARNGFGRTTIDVAAGARLVLPYSQTAPFTITAANGRSVKGTGDIMGSVRFAEGGVLDATQDLPSIEDLQLADGATVKLGARSSLPVDMSMVAKADGVITIDAASLVQPGGGPSRTIALTGFGEGVIRNGTTFAVSGLGGGARAELENGTVTIVQFNGTMLIFR